MLIRGAVIQRQPKHIRVEVRVIYGVLSVVPKAEFKLVIREK